MGFLLVVLVVCILSGCACFQEPDFNKPLIVLPQDTDDLQNAATRQNEETKTKPPENKIWIETKTSKLWVNPYVDENGDLVEGHYKDIVTDQGHWELKPDEPGQ